MAGVFHQLRSSFRACPHQLSRVFISSHSVCPAAAWQAPLGSVSRHFSSSALARAEQQTELQQDAEAKKPDGSEGILTYEEDPQEAAEFERYGEGAVYPPKGKGKNWVAQLHLKSFDPRQIDYACGYVRHLAALLGVQTGGAIPLPKKTLLLSLIRSPHVHKTSQEQFHQITYKRLICCYNTAPEVLDKFFETLDERPPQGVQIKVTQRTKIAPPEGKP